MPECGIAKYDGQSLPKFTSSLKRALKYRFKTMRLNLKHVAFVAAMIVGLVAYCEFLVYYLVVWWGCRYPSLPQTQNKNQGYQIGGKPVLHVMFLADTHLLGRRLGHWFDKLRREWQMRQSFSAAYRIFNPELVFFLGDVFDEAKWCGKDEFDDYLRRFKTLFYHDPHRTKVYVVAGNHDVGFHYAVTPYLQKRFNDAMKSSDSGIERISMKNIQFVLVNSMAMHGDSCFLCSKAVEGLDQISEELECMKNKEVCHARMEYEGQSQPADSVTSDVYSRPILLQHFPLFRTSDTECGDEPDVAPSKEKTKPFRPLWDSLSETSSQLLLKKLQPRFVISAHTHHGCKVKHKVMIKASDSRLKFPFAQENQKEAIYNDEDDVPDDLLSDDEEMVEDMVDEWSVASFSWRNRNNPNFLLAKITNDDVALSKCYLPEEETVITVYIFVGVFIFFYALMTRRKFVRRF